MRKSIAIILLAITCFASATVKDPRKLVPVAPLTQDEVARQQALQRGQGTVGLVPQKTNDSGYVPQSQNDTDASAIVASRADKLGSDSANDIVSKSGDDLNAEAQKPRKTAFGALWALFAGLLLAFGAWAGLQKYGPKPPAHLR